MLLYADDRTLASRGYYERRWIKRKHDDTQNALYDKRPIEVIDIDRSMLKTNLLANLFER
jgi:hypothetical protein